MIRRSRTEQRTKLVELIFATGITFITGVPDSEFCDLIAGLELTELNKRYIPATREDNAIALAVGAYLGGEQPLVFMESSGIGTSLDALTSLAIVYGIPLVLFIAWAGYKGRDVPHHNPIGKSLPLLLTSLDIPFLEVDLGHSSEFIASAIQETLSHANASRWPAAILGIPKELGDDKR